MADGCIGPINIIPDNNEVVLQDVNQVITVIDNNCCTTVDITQPTTAVVQILTGPMGVFPTEGPYGFTGSFGISGSLTVTGSISSNYIQSPYFTGSFYGNGTGIFSGSFSGSISSNLQEVTDNGATTTNVISASGLDTNALNVLGNVNVTGSLTVSGSNTFRNIGPAQFTGSTDITGSLSVNGVDYEFTSASFDTRILNNSSSISLLSGSFLNTSGSLSTRVTDLESFSSSLDATFATDAELNAATASLSSSIAYLSSSYLSDSSSFDIRILENSSSIEILSGSYLNSSGSFSIRITDLESFSSSLDSTFATDSELNAATASLSGSISYLSSSYLDSSASFNTRILDNSSSIALLSGSFINFSSSYSTGSFTGSFTGSLEGTASNAVTASYILNAISSSYAATASNILGGKATYIPFFKTDTTLATSSIYQSGSTSIIINQDANTTANPEALYVWQPSTSSFNVISGKGNLNNYLQLNIQNTNQGLTASSDVVATANNGDEFTNYIDMGINGENFTGDIGGANDAYLYSTGNHLHIGNASPNQPLGLFVGGLDAEANRKLVLRTTNLHEMSGSLDISGSLIVRNSITGSLLGTASYAINALSSSYALTASYAATSSYLTLLKQQIILSGSFKLDPTQDPDPTGLDLDSTVLFQSSSNTALGYDLYVRQNGNLVKWKWIEGILETGLLYGGVVTYSGSNVFVSPGSGIIAEHNATTGSEISPMIEYVTWNAITQSITNIATQQVTYLYIDNTGALQQQSTRFTSQQYHDYIPLGAVGHFDYTQVSAFGGGVQTAYDQISQISNFVDAFGPLKMSGYGLTGQAGSLRLSVGSGTSFIHGGFYQNNPEFPSQTTTPLQVTASLARVNRSGSVIEFDTNAGNFYTVVDPTKYDRDGDGTLANVGSGNWSIQRVFSDPKTGVLYVYYGQARYTSLLNALQFLPTDPFTEGDTFDFTTFIGFLVLKGNASDITDTANNSVINGGLFRGSGQGSGGGIALSNLEDLTDVSITSPINGQALIYDAGIWQNGVPTNSTSASFALTASYLSGYVSPFPYTGSAIITGSLIITGSTVSTLGFTGSLEGTSSWAQNSVSASYATTASFLLGGVVSASYAATSSHATNFVVESTLALNGTLTDSATVNSSIVGSNNLFTQATGSRTSAFGKYTIFNGANARAGEFITVWNGTTTTYTDTSTTDIGSTADITFSSIIVGGNIEIDAVAASSGWKIKMLTTFI